MKIIKRPSNHKPEVIVKDMTMKSTESDGSKIDELLKTLRCYNDIIGDYEQHLILPDDGTYAIKLTNGSIRIYPEELQDKQALLQDRLKDIAARFRERK
jgi:hypothetical protein